MSWEYMRNFMAQILILLTLRGLKLPRFDGNQASEWRKITWQISSIIETYHWYSSELVDLRWWIKELTILWFIITSHPPIWPFFFWVKTGETIHLSSTVSSHEHQVAGAENPAGTGECAAQVPDAASWGGFSMAGRRGCKKTMGFYITWLWYHDYDGVYGIFLNNIILWEDNDDGGDDDDDTKKQWETQWFIIRFPLIHYEHGKGIAKWCQTIGGPLSD